MFFILDSGTAACPQEGGLGGQRLASPGGLWRGRPRGGDCDPALPSRGEGLHILRPRAHVQRVHTHTHALSPSLPLTLHLPLSPPLSLCLSSPHSLPLLLPLFFSLSPSYTHTHVYQHRFVHRLLCERARLWIMRAPRVCGQALVHGGRPRVGGPEQRRDAGAAAGRAPLRQDTGEPHLPIPENSSASKTTAHYGRIRVNPLPFPSPPTLARLPGPDDTPHLGRAEGFAGR